MLGKLHVVGLGSRLDQKPPEDCHVKEVAMGTTTARLQSMAIETELCNQKFSSIIDTACQVTVLSTDIFHDHETLKNSEKVWLRGAGKNSRMPGHFVEHVPCKIGGISYEISAYIAPITDPMLLGLDFLRAHDAHIDLVNQTLRLDGQWVDFAYLGNAPRADVGMQRVCSAENITLPVSAHAWSTAVKK